RLNHGNPKTLAATHRHVDIQLIEFLGHLIMRHSPNKLCNMGNLQSLDKPLKYSSFRAVANNSKPKLVPSCVLLTTESITAFSETFDQSVNAIRGSQRFYSSDSKFCRTAT